MSKRKTISDVLRESAQQAKGVRQLAREADIDHATLLRFLNGSRVRSDQLDRLAEALGYELRRRKTKGK